MNLGGLLSIFSKKDQSVLGIDIGSSAIKVVQIKKKRGKMVLETYGELALGPYAGIEIGRATSLGTEKVAIALKDILKEAKTTTLSAGVALPLSSSLISFVTLPKVDEKQMGDVIALEARKYIPVPMSEVMLDWSLIPREGTFNTEEKDKNNENEKDLKDQKNLQKEMQDVLILAIHNEYINTYQNIMNVATIKPSFFEIELFSSIRAVVDQGIQSVMIIDVGASSTKLYIVERGVLRASHIINKGSQDITLALSKALSIGVN